ncbi:MAG: isochorismatase family protein [Prevotella sp.]|jgi:nicotinamidase/pyrazinamidase
MKKLLLVIDAQRDFLEGSLSVEGAPQMMDLLADYVRQHDGNYLLKVFTQDWHPYHHSSFKINGGIWPVHCLQHSDGAGIHSSLVEAAFATKGEIVFLTKGIRPEVEEYSIFDNEESANRLRQLVADNGIEQIDICGVAREYCVKESLLGAIKSFGAERIHLLNRFIAAISDEHALDQIVQDYHIAID